MLPQVNSVVAVVNGVGESVLYDALKREEDLNPEGTLQDHLRRAGTYLVPANVPGSPAYPRNALQELLAIVDKHGVPSFFLTLTADELTDQRWKDVGALEALMQHLTQNPGMTWRDMPCEMARHFRDRVNAFMQTHNHNNNHRQHWQHRANHAIISQYVI